MTQFITPRFTEHDLAERHGGMGSIESPKNIRGQDAMSPVVLEKLKAFGRSPKRSADPA